MTEITIRVDPEILRRLRARAQQAGTTVPLLVTDLVHASAQLLSDPEWTVPPRSVLRRVGELLDHEASPEMIAHQLDMPADAVATAIRELARLKRVADRYTQ